jgi:hypothetical protein
VCDDLSNVLRDSDIAGSLSDQEASLSRLRIIFLDDSLKCYEYACMVSVSKYRFCDDLTDGYCS